MTSEEPKKMDFKKWTKLAIIVFTCLILVSLTTALIQFLVQDKQIRYYYMLYIDGDYFIRAEVKHGFNFPVYKTTDPKEALDILDRFNGKPQTERIVYYSSTNPDNNIQINPWTGK